MQARHKVYKNHGGYLLLTEPFLDPKSKALTELESVRATVSLHTLTSKEGKNLYDSLLPTSSIKIQ